MPEILYWDTSALLSAIFRDAHSDDAQQWARRSGVHLLSTLAWAEAHAVIARIERERVLAAVLLHSARETLGSGPWRRVNASPEWAEVRKLSGKWPLRGADLWHLAAAKSLRVELPELVILTYDVHLAAAARGEDLAAGGP